MLHTSNPQPASMMLDGSPSSKSIKRDEASRTFFFVFDRPFEALDRQGSRYSNGTNRQMKKSDSNECLTGFF